MATLQELLSQTDPDMLKKILGQTSTDKTDITPDFNPDAIPTPGPTPPPITTPAPSIPAPTGMGPLSNPNDYKPSVTPDTEDETDTSDITDAPPKNQVRTSSTGSSKSTPDTSASIPEQGFTNNTVAGLQAAQDQTNKDKNLADLRTYAAMTMSGAQGLQNHTAPPSIENEIKLGESQKKSAEDSIEQYQARGAKEKDDPKSAASAQSRDLARAMLKQAGMNINIPDNVSASDIEKRFPQFQHLATTKENADMRRDLASEKAKDRAAMLEASKSTKADAAQDKAIQTTQQLLESARGNPAAAQAEKDLYSASKADSLANMYGDPNKLSPQQTKLYTSEIAKIATGGVPTQGELEALNSGSAQGKLAEVWSRISNKPQPANAGDFIKAFQDYSKGLKEDAKKVIQDKYGRVIEGRKKQLGDEGYQSMKAQYLDRFVQPEKDTAPQQDMVKVISPEGKSGTIPKSKLQEALKRGFKESQ